MLVPLSAVGCSIEPPREVHPCAGRVLYKGQPVSGAELVFFPAEGKPALLTEPVPRATCDSDGLFRVSYYEEGDGLPAGDFVVCLTWPMLPDGSDNADDAFDRLQGRYATVANPAARISVSPGANDLASIEIP